MVQAYDEEYSQQVQRFDTPVIRDLDFPKESGNQAMPGQQDETVSVPEPEPEISPVSAEQTAEQLTQETPPAGSLPETLPETVIQPEEQEPQAAEQAAETAPGLPPEPEKQSAQQQTQVNEQVTKLDPACIPKYVNQLIKPPVCVSTNSGDDKALYVIDISEFKQQILPPGFPETTVWGYGGTVMDEETCRFRYYQNAPGATIEAVRNVPLSVKWISKLNSPSYRASIVTYPNNQEASTLWYHEDAPEISTRSAYAGLAGLYLLRSGKEFTWRIESILPKGRYEIPLVIQDQSFNRDGSLLSAAAHLGDSIMVNGKVWPNLDIERRQYRFRILNGSGARFYNLRMSNGMKLTQIGDGSGFLPEPVALESLLLAPGARADVLADFSILPPDTKILLNNDAGATFPVGGAPEPNTTGRIMQFTIPFNSPGPVKPKKLPQRLNT